MGSIVGYNNQNLREEREKTIGKFQAKAPYIQLHAYNFMQKRLKQYCLSLKQIGYSI
jgi:hypothetical protein